MRFLVAISFLLVLANPVASNNTAFYYDLLDRGNTAYDQGQYDSAITYYSQIVNSDFQSKALYYNLGNAYFKNNELAPAIYYYEMALKLSPNDADVQFNLEMANSQIADKVLKKPVPISEQAWIGLSSLFTPNGWGYATVIALIIALSLLTFYLISDNVNLKPLTFFGSVGFIIVTIVCFIVGNSVRNALISQDHAIVFTSTLNVKSEPKLASADLFVIHEGTKVNVLEELDEWVRIALPDGNEGWVQIVDIKTF